MTAAYRTKWTSRDAYPVSGSVHGGGRRPGRQAALDLHALAKWNAAQRAAVMVNRDREAAERRRDAIVVRDSQ